MFQVGGLPHSLKSYSSAKWRGWSDDGSEVILRPDWLEGTTSAGQGYSFL